MKTKNAVPSGNGNVDTHAKITKKLPYRKSSAVKMLERLADNAAKAQVPIVLFLASRWFHDNTAFRLAKCMLAFLRIKGNQAESVNSTARIVGMRKSFTVVFGRRGTIGYYKWGYGAGMIGMEDMSRTINGRSVKVEIRVGRDRQSESKRIYQAEVERSGGIYFIARTFAGFLDWYNNHFEG